MLRITHPKVSSHHARVLIEGSEYRIEDLNSSNGTFVNGKKVIISKISAADTIMLGPEQVLSWQAIKNVSSSLSGQGSQPTLPVQQSSAHFDADSFVGKAIITVGRTPENDIIINNVKVSRNHARFIKTGSGWVLEDLGSSNGTFVNGKKISGQPVQKSDKVTIGGTPVDMRFIFDGVKPVPLEGLTIGTRKATLNIDSKTIIDDVTLTIYPGEFVGLIGPSGAGKTTLMMLMTGTVKPSHGDIFINDVSLTQNFNSFKGQLGYVPQDDIIHRELLVEESFKYTAKLRLEDQPEFELDAQVDSVIQMLDLGESRKTLIGSAEKKGISGGQRKRVNLGQELITEPSILFLDEPTSGLDPKTDIDVMKLLQNIAAKGKIIVLTTHNITVENFEILSHVVVLSKGGKLAYFGPANEAVSYFNVKKPYEIFDAIKSQSPDYWKEHYRGSSYYREYVDKRLNTDIRTTTNANPEKNEREANLKQVMTLAKRFLTIKIRDKVSTSILLIQAPIIALLIWIVFNRAEEHPQALFVLIIAAIWLGCSNAAREIVSEQSIYKRERMVNLKIPSYLISKFAILSVLCVIQCLILAGMTSAAMNLDIAFPNLFVLLFVTSLAAVSIGLFISSLVSTTEAAMGLIPLVLIPQVILGGLISYFGRMPDAIKFLSGFMISRWGFEAALIGAYGDRNNQIITNIGYSPDNMVIDFIMVVLFSVVFLGLTAYSLKRKDVV